MWIVAVDPGETIGFAGFDTEYNTVLITHQTTNPLDIARRLWGWKDLIDVAVIESFPGGGPRTTAAIHTLKVLGFVEYYAKHLDLNVVLQVPQERKWKVKEARLLAPNMPHATDALAHALSYAALRT